MLKVEIQNCLTWYANKVAETVQYDIWSDEFCRKEIKESTETFLKAMKKYIDWNNLTKEEAWELRFRRWDEDVPNLYLIPLYLLPILPIGTEVTSISGDKIIYDGQNLDNDVRFGCIAYGIEIKENNND